jgi:hypothetical protein
MIIRIKSSKQIARARKRRERVDESGRQTIFQVPISYEQAKKKFQRAVIAARA